jgi:hypothetical protein
MICTYCYSSNKVDYLSNKYLPTQRLIPAAKFGNKLKEKAYKLEG